MLFELVIIYCYLGDCYVFWLVCAFCGVWFWFDCWVFVVCC